jgi:hypothetical protein
VELIYLLVVQEDQEEVEVGQVVQEDQEILRQLVHLKVIMVVQPEHLLLLVEDMVVEAELQLLEIIIQEEEV